MTKNTGNADFGIIPVLSFFTGGGFLDIGFASVGFTTVWTNENNEIFANMYEFAIPSINRESKRGKLLEKIADKRSIDDIKSAEIIRKAFPSGRPNFFGIIGGPPCPDFSNGGKHKGHVGDNGRLSKIFVDRICTIKPSFFVFENVHGLLKTEKHKTFLQKIERDFQKAGYCVERGTLNSLCFGLAQDRDRIFLVGIKRAILKELLGRDIKNGAGKWFPWPSVKYKYPKLLYEWPTINKNGNAPEKPAGIPDDLMVYNLLANIPADLPNANEAFRPYSHKFITVREGDTAGKSFKRLHRYRYSPTACYGNNEVHLHPWENRRLSVREAMRIQGIPDNYTLPTSAPLSSKFKMVANGVPVPLAEQIALSLNEFLKPIGQSI